MDEGRRSTSRIIEGGENGYEICQKEAYQSRTRKDFNLKSCYKVTLHSHRLFSKFHHYAISNVFCHIKKLKCTRAFYLIFIFFLNKFIVFVCMCGCKDVKFCVLTVDQ